MALPKFEFDPVGRCIYCRKLEKEVSRLTDEHIIPEGMGGELVLPKSSCDDCSKHTTRFEQNVQRIMLAATRAHFNLYGKRRKATRPTEFAVHLDDGEKQIPLQEYPYSLFMPLLDPPRILACLPIEPELPDLTEPERIWKWSSPDANEQGKKILQRTPSKTLKITQQIWLSDFYKLLAKIGHSYAIAQLGYSSVQPLLNGLILAPKRAHTHGATSYIGGAFDRFRNRVETIKENNDPYTLHMCECNFENGNGKALVVRIQLFSHIDAPVYDVVVGVWKRRVAELIGNHLGILL